MTFKKAFLCISCFYKGDAFLEACKQAGNKVFLVTSEKLRNAEWPWDAIDEVYYMQEGLDGGWNNEDLLAGLAHLMQHHSIDRIIALDDFDVERAAMLREHFRIPGMGQSTSRHFRDKLAMRLKAKESGIQVPAFSSLFNNQTVQTFLDNNQGPWFVKPRSEASATGIHKVLDQAALWTLLDSLGDQRHHYLIESFVPGNVYHVDSLVYQKSVIFTSCSQYLNPPFEVAHHGGIFRTRTLDNENAVTKELESLNAQLLGEFGLHHGASHSEYIRHQDTGVFYFLETSSRVGGAHIAEMVEAGTGINLWREWAVMESQLLQDKDYVLPEIKLQLAATIISLSKYEHPDTVDFNDPEIWWRMKKDYHVGFILQSKDATRITELVAQYTQRIASDLHAAVPAPDRSNH